MGKVCLCDINSTFRSGIEGPLYICHTSDNDYLLIITNQSNHLDFTAPLLPTSMYSTQSNYIFWKCADNQTWAVWFFEDEKRLACWYKVTEIMTSLGMTLSPNGIALHPSAQPKPTQASPAPNSSNGGAILLNILKKPKTAEAEKSSVATPAEYVDPLMTTPAAQSNSLLATLHRKVPSTVPKDSNYGTNDTILGTSTYADNAKSTSKMSAPPAVPIFDSRNLTSTTTNQTISAHAVAPALNIPTTASVAAAILGSGEASGPQAGSDSLSQQQQQSSSKTLSLTERVAKELLLMPEFQKLVDVAVGRVLGGCT